jgi:hypothetical protein
MSSPKQRSKSSVNQQVKAGISAVRDFLSGRSGEAKAAAADDKATREVVAAELVAAMSGRSSNAPSEKAGDSSHSDTQEIPKFNSEASSESAHGETEQTSKAGAEALTSANAATAGQANSENASEDEQKRARELFLDHGYFDEAVQNLRAANSPTERAEAARAIGLYGSQRGTPHLIAAMFDSDADVRSAAEEALDRISKSKVTDSPAKSAANKKIVSEKPNNISPSASATAKAKSAPVSVVQPEEEAKVVEPSASSGMDAATPVSAAPAVTREPDLTATDASGIGEDEQLLLEELRIREEAERFSQQLLETAAARKKAEQEGELRTEAEAKLRREAAAQRRKEEKLRKQADEEAERNRTQEREAVAVELAARLEAESETQRLVEEEFSLRLRGAGLRQAGEELARQRMDKENARREAAEAARIAAATSARNKAKAHHDAELGRLQSEEEGLKKASEALALRHAEVEAAREKADAESERLIEAQARMRAAEETRARAEVERSQLEIEINQKVETQLRLLDETRRRGQEEQERMQEETRRRAEEEQQRRREMESLKAAAEEESKQKAEQERQILSQIESMRIADAETRKRITDAEVRRRAAEDAYRLIADKVQRVEAEAHARAKEEEQMLAKLETERRTVAGEAQSRASQEKRIREEIELFRRLEEQERPRIEEAMLQRAAAETRLQEQRDRLKAEEDARASADEQASIMAKRQEFLAEQARSISLPDGGNEAFSNTASRPDEVVPVATETVPEAVSVAKAEDETGAGDEVAVQSVTPAIATYLNSVDPYKRAAAVAELARSRPEEAFDLISSCFDDHSPHVRNAAARAMRKLEPTRTVDLFNRALEEASDDRRRNIGGAIAASGLATEAINNLVSENREDISNALSLLFVMAKTGEVTPLVNAVEEHPDDEIGRAAAKLLTLSGYQKQ